MKRLLSVALGSLILAGCGDSTQTDSPAPADAATSAAEAATGNVAVDKPSGEQPGLVTSTDDESASSQESTESTQPTANEETKKDAETVAENSAEKSSADDTAPDPDAKEKLTEKKPLTPEEQLAEIQSAYQTEYNDFLKAYRGAKTADERRKLINKQPNRTKYGRQMMDLAAANPKTDVEFEALSWAAQNAGMSAASQKLIQSYPDREEIALLILRMERDRSAEGTLRQLLDSDNELVKACATYSLGKVLLLKGDDEAATLLKKVVTDYKDTEVKIGSRSMKIAPRAEGALFEAENLQIGMVAPDIKGDDLDGVEFALSDYRGKVVLLDFWGNW